MDPQTACTLMSLHERSITDDEFRASIRQELVKLSDQDIARWHLGAELPSCPHCGSGLFFLFKGGHSDDCPIAHPGRFPEHKADECAMCQQAAAITRYENKVKEEAEKIYLERGLDQFEVEDL